MEREVTTHHGNHLNDAIKITAFGEPGPGGACLRYRACVPMINPVEQHVKENSARARTYCDVNFQNGNPADEINGISNEALLAIVLDRLQGFQSGPFACEKNKWAMVCVEDALQTLKSRTAERQERGVEGQQIK